MTRTTVAILVVLLVGVTLASGTVAAQPEDAGPPDELPSAVPDFVSDVLEGVGDAFPDLPDVVDDVTPSGVPPFA